MVMPYPTTLPDSAVAPNPPPPPPPSSALRGLHRPNMEHRKIRCQNHQQLPLQGRYGSPRKPTAATVSALFNTLQRQRHPILLLVVLLALHIPTASDPSRDTVHHSRGRFSFSLKPRRDQLEHYTYCKIHSLPMTYTIVTTVIIFTNYQRRASNV